MNRPKRVALCALLFCSMIEACVAKADGDVASPGEDIASELASVFQDAQADRLLRGGGRDDLIASLLISNSPGGAVALTIDDSEAARRLTKDYPADELAAYILALLCHLQKAPCMHPEYREQLLKLDSANAIHWLVVPSGSQLASEDLQRASEAEFADSHFSQMLGIVRRSLQDQGAGRAAPAAWRGNRELDLMLRRNEISRVPWPSYAQAIAACGVRPVLSPEDASIKRQCAGLGALLFAERGNNMASKSIGSTMLRRHARNTPQAEAAIRFRRQYVWISEQLPTDRSSEARERLNEEEISLGEWEAYQRSAERSGVPREPPSDWIPKRPELLLLQEERTPSPPPEPTTSR